jgi:hypothetical protein
MARRARANAPVKVRVSNNMKYIQNLRVLMRLEDVLKEGDREALFTDVLPEITDRWMWPEALRHITRMKGKVHPSLALPLHGMWSLHGGYICTVTNDDLLVIRALRKLLPPYRGGPKKLYRGETLKDRRQRTYGISWSSSKKVARTYCMDGGVLLAAQVPEEAIVAKINKGWDHFYDDEYLVDRRALGRVEAIERAGVRQ